MFLVTQPRLLGMKEQGQKIAVLTAYDATFAHLLDEAGVDVLLVGDSLGMVLQGEKTTLPVTLEDMIYHCRSVVKGVKRALVMVDMPFMSDASVTQGLASAARLMKEGLAQMVKLEGGQDKVPLVQALVSQGIPVCGHLGLLPQSVNKLGGYKVQGRDENSASQMMADALALQAAGIGLLVLECVPASLAKKLSVALDIPVIGIGAGVDCDGQVLVLHDMLGITVGKAPVFSRDFVQDTDSIQAAIKLYVKDVKSSQFPSLEHSF